MALPLNGHEIRVVAVEGACDPRAVRDYLNGRPQRPTTIVHVERGLRAINRADLIRGGRQAA